jgi:hypothetical protein
MTLLVDWAGNGWWRVTANDHELAKVRELEINVPSRTVLMGTQKGFLEVEGTLTISGEHGVIG